MTNFYEWLDQLVVFLKGYYAGSSIEMRWRPATEIFKEAVQAYKIAFHETDWIEEKVEKG